MTVVLASCLVLNAQAEVQTVKIAWTDPLSGFMAPIGQLELDAWRQATEIANAEKWAGDYRFEIVPFDNKLSTSETLTVFGTTVDRGIQYIAQGNSSAAGIALIDAIEKHNTRNPGKEVIYLNYMAADPDMTNKYCSYWQFRFEAHSGMKMKALISQLAKDRSLKKVFLIHQNYAHGQTSSAAAVEFLTQVRPDIQIVGNELHPLASVKDFAPYVAKIKASGADAVITANWGSDLSMLVRAMSDFGSTVPIYNFFSQNPGVPTAMGKEALLRAKTVTVFNPNGSGPRAEEITTAFKKKYDKDFILPQIYNTVGMLAKAIRSAGSADPKKVAVALEGMTYEGLNGALTMRKSDHQLQQPLYLASWVKVDGKGVKFEQEGLGLGLRNDSVISPDEASRPTTCEMKRP